MDLQHVPSTPPPVTPTTTNTVLPDNASLSSHRNLDNSRHVVDHSPSREEKQPVPPSPYSRQLEQPTRSLTPVLTPTSQAPPSNLSSPSLSVAQRMDNTRDAAKELLSLSEEHISQASPAQLRSIVARLFPALEDARTDAAQYRLQYQMLAIESAEAVERIQVEMDMAQRELEVLNAVDHQHDPVHVVPALPVVDPSVRSVHVDLYNAMMSEIRDLKARDSRQELVISQQKRMIVQQESEIASMNDRVLLLRERLQENRDHRNRQRGSSAIPESIPPSERGTPHRARLQRSNAPAYTHPQRPFAALLHATDLMSHKSPSMPSTPKRKRDEAPSLPLTPQTAQPRSSRNLYATPQSSRPAQLKVPMSAPAPRIAPFTNRGAPTVNAQRDQDSDGTVSATDDSEAETEVEGEDIEESQASLLASDLLRTPTRPGKSQSQRNVATAIPLTQTKLYGPIKKSGVQREDEERQFKKVRAGERSSLEIAGCREA